MKLSRLETLEPSSSTRFRVPEIGVTKLRSEVQAWAREQQVWLCTRVEITASGAQYMRVWNLGERPAKTALNSRNSARKALEDYKGKVVSIKQRAAR